MTQEWPKLGGGVICGTNKPPLPNPSISYDFDSWRGVPHLGHRQKPRNPTKWVSYMVRFTCCLIKKRKRTWYKFLKGLPLAPGLGFFSRLGNIVNRNPPLVVGFFPSTWCTGPHEFLSCRYFEGRVGFCLNKRANSLESSLHSVSSNSFM